MKDDPDMGTQSGEERIDELLSGYIDDELAIRQRTEVERLIAHDLGIERRLQKLRKSVTLSSPCANRTSMLAEIGVEQTAATMFCLRHRCTVSSVRGRRP